MLPVPTEEEATGSSQPVKELTEEQKQFDAIIYSQTVCISLYTQLCEGRGKVITCAHVL